MTSSSTNKNNNNQPQQPQQRSVNNNNNQFVDFFPGFKIQQENFGKTSTSPTEQYDSKAKKTTIVRKPFPYIRNLDERVYDRFITDVVDPSTNTFYPPRDDYGTPIPQPDNGPNCRHVVNSIIRIRLVDGTEKLYTLGQLIGYDSFGTRRSMSADFRETYQNIIFGKDRKYDSKTKRIITYTTGPVGMEIKYDLDYNAENVDMLFQKTDNGKNPFFKSSKKGNKRVVLIVKDAANGTAVEVYWHSPERSLELFKTRSFAELFNATYIPLPVRQEMRGFSQGLTESLTGEKPQPIPKVEDSSNNNNNNKDGSNSNSDSKDFSQYK